MPQILHNQSLDENSAVFCYSLLALHQKRDFIRTSIEVPVTAASILLFAAIGLLIWNLMRETYNLRTLQEQILSLCQSTEYERIVSNESDE
jgi:hypothetical protein